METEDEEELGEEAKGRVCLRIRKASVLGAQKGGGKRGTQRKLRRCDKLRCLKHPSRRHK